MLLLGRWGDDGGGADAVVTASTPSIVVAVGGTAATSSPASSLSSVFLRRSFPEPFSGGNCVSPRPWAGLVLVRSGSAVVFAPWFFFFWPSPQITLRSVGDGSRAATAAAAASAASTTVVVVVVVVAVVVSAAGEEKEDVVLPMPFWVIIMVVVAIGGSGAVLWIVICDGMAAVVAVDRGVVS